MFKGLRSLFKKREELPLCKKCEHFDGKGFCTAKTRYSYVYGKTIVRKEDAEIERIPLLGYCGRRGKHITPLAYKKLCFGEPGGSHTCKVFCL